MRRRALDLAPSVLLGALGLAQIAGLDAGDEFAGPAWLDVVALLACVVPLAWRRRIPGAVLLAVVTANVVWTQLLFAPTDEVVLETWFALLVAVWAVAVDGSRRDLPLVSLAVVLEIGEAVAEQLRGVAPSQQAVPAVSFVAAAAAGWAVRYYRRTAALLEQRTRELARERDERAVEAVELERGRIARELHDLVTHALSVVVLHASAEREQLSPAEPGYGALTTIEEVSRTALTDLRRLLGLLRANPADLDPQPTLGELPSVVAWARTAGVDVALTVPDDVDDLDPALQLTAFRIVQEALTNAMKHAAPCRAQVAVRRHADRLAIAVVNSARNGDTAPVAPAGGRHGLIGMRERARLFGGTFSAGVLPDGGFAVEVTLPVVPVPACPAVS